MGQLRFVAGRLGCAALGGALAILVAGLGRITLPMGANYGDLDNDGYPDFYLATGYPFYDGLMPNVAYHNLDGRRFADVTSAAGLGHLQKGHAVVFADLDDDGDQDLFGQTGGRSPGTRSTTCCSRTPGSGITGSRCDWSARSRTVSGSAAASVST